MLQGLLALLLLCLACGGAHARQVALVVGIARYEQVPSLKNPQRDAAAMADKLRDQGFEVIEAFDADRFALERARARFLAQARGADLALFYFAGHGIQLFDRNVLLSRDAAPAAARSIDDLGLDLTRFMGDLRAAGPVRTALLIDACRDNPLAFEDTVQLLRRLDPGAAAGSGGGTRGAGARPTRGLSVVELPAATTASGKGTGETLVFFAAQPGQVSYDGDGRNSYFVEGLVEALARADRPLAELLRSAGAYVRTVTKGQQVPQLVSDWTGDVVLGRTEAAKIRYLNTFKAKGDGSLSEADARTVGAATRAHDIFRGTFIVKESQSFTQNWLEASEAEQARVKAIGSVNGFAIDYDLDRDGRDETIGVYFRQTNVVVEVVDEGVSLLDTPCFDEGKDQVEAVAIALRDINGDRRPEIFFHYQTEPGNWGNLCVLEFVGSSGLADQRRGAQSTGFAGRSLFRTLLRHEGAWSVSVGADNSIETCSGSNCHTRSAFAFDGTHFRMTLDQSDAPTPAKARPFRDHDEHVRNQGPATVAAKPAVAKTAASPQPPAAVPAAPVAAIARFVAEVYLPSGTTGSTTALQYEPQVAYYGKATSRTAVLADKARYVTRWPRRSYALVPASLNTSPNPAGGGLVDVTFDYAFDVSDGKKSSAGLGRTRLTLKPAGSGFVIAREEGEVVTRR